MRAIYEGCYLDSLRTTAAENGATNALYMAGFGTNANSSTVPNLPVVRSTTVQWTGRHSNNARAERERSWRRW